MALLVCFCGSTVALLVFELRIILYFVGKHVCLVVCFDLSLCVLGCILACILNRHAEICMVFSHPHLLTAKALVI